MKRKICDIGYINRIWDNLLDVKGEELLPLYENLKSADCIVCGGSLLDRKSNYKIVLEEKVKPGQPRRFYMRAAYVLSPLPVKLTERLSEKGLKLPEYVLNWHHSVIE